MIYICNSVIATELHSDWEIYKNTISQILEKVGTTGPLPPKYKIFEKSFC